VTEGPGSTEHYAIVGVGRTLDNPSGLARRRSTPQGAIDEAVQRDLSWQPTNAITQWEYGNFPGELIKIDTEQANALVERFREKWGREG